MAAAVVVCPRDVASVGACHWQRASPRSSLDLRFVELSRSWSEFDRPVRALPHRSQCQHRAGAATQRATQSALDPRSAAGGQLRLAAGGPQASFPSTSNPVINSRLLLMYSSFIAQRFCARCAQRRLENLCSQDLICVSHAPLRRSGELRGDAKRLPFGCWRWWPAQCFWPCAPMVKREARLLR